MMKHLLVLICLTLSGIAHANSICGKVESLAVVGGNRYEVRFVNGKVLSKVAVRPGQDAFLVASMTNGLNVCFAYVKNGGPDYDYNMISTISK